VIGSEKRDNFFVISHKTPNFGTFQAITIPKQWRPLSLFLVRGHIRPSASQIPRLKL